MSLFLKRALVAGSLFLFVAFVYQRSPVHYLADSSYSLLMDEAILEHGSPDLMPYQVPRGEGPHFPNHGYLRTIDIVNGRLLYIYPWGGALLSLPAVAFFDALGLKAAPGGVYDSHNERNIQARTAAILCAAVVAIMYVTASLFLSDGWSLAIALGAAFGTPLWSTASRSLWPQTWCVVLISLCIWELAKAKPRPVLLGTLLAWDCFARPQALPIVPVVSLYLLTEFGLPAFLKYSGAVVAWGSVFAATMLFFYGRLLPPVYASSTASIDFYHGLLLRSGALLFSPSRGLLVFLPIVLFPLYLIVRYWRKLSHQRLALLALVVIFMHFLITASWAVWWGGWSYGPRMLMETIPWFVLLTIIGVRAFLDDGELPIRARFATIAAAILLLAVSVAMNAPGALSPASRRWDATPNIDDHPERLWDWKHPQFLAWAQGA